MTTYDIVASIVAERGGTVRLATFDGGQTVYMRLPGETVRAFTSHWGDPETASERALAALRPTPPVSPVVGRARAGELPFKVITTWDAERATYDDELNYWREKFAPKED